MKKPKEILHPKAVRYVLEKLEVDLKNSDLELGMNKKTFLSSKERDANEDTIDIIGLQGSTKEAVIIVADDVKLKNRTEITNTTKRNILSKYALLQQKKSRLKFLIFTDPGMYFAFRTHMENISDEKLIVEHNPQRFHFKSNGITVQLIEFPVFENTFTDAQSQRLTFSQILVAIQHGFINYAELPETGIMLPPPNVKEQDLVSKPEKARLKQIFNYLFENSGHESGDKSKSSKSKSNKGSGGPSSPPRVKRKVKQTVRP